MAIEKERANGKKIVLGHGIFDFLHYGHIYYLWQAKRLGDILVVSVILDKFVDKGDIKPVFNEKVRASFVAVLESVDYVILCENYGPWDIIRAIKPDIFAKGEDSLPQLKIRGSGLNKDKKLVESLGGIVRFTKSLPIHSAELLKNYSGNFSSDLDLFLAAFKSNDFQIRIPEIPSLSVIMPAYNEVGNLKPAYESTIRALKKAGIIDYEIIIITNTRRDGSHDGTPDIATQITTENPWVRHIHNNAYVGLGFKFRQGANEARKDYVMMIPGDNETVEDSIASIVSHLGEAEMVIFYTANKKVRKWKRRFVSWGFTTLCNVLFGLNLRYYNGVCIYPAKLLRAVPMACDNFAYMAEIIIYLVKSGVKYIEVPMEIKPTTASAAFKFRSVIEVLGTLTSLFWRINIKRERIKLSF